MWPRNPMVFLLVTDMSPSETASRLHHQRADQKRYDLLGSMEWHLRLAKNHVRSPHVILPESLKTCATIPALGIGQGQLIWYSDELLPSLPKARAKEDVWIVNAAQWLTFDWRVARRAAHDRVGDVLVLSTAEWPTGGHYSESVHSDESGEVVRLRRWYTDSPTSADPWSGAITALVCRGADIPAVTSHLILYGWSLDSIGRLTRRFQVAWEMIPNGWNLAVNGAPANAARQSYGMRFGQQSWSPGLIVERDGPVARPLGSTSAGRQVIMAGRGKNHTTIVRPVRTAGDRHVGTLGSVSSSNPQAGPIDGGLLTAEMPKQELLEPGLPVGHAAKNRTYHLAKRVVDVAVSAAVLAVLLLPLAVIAALIKVTSRGPVLFGHLRQGLGGKDFHCLKFRTMVKDAEAMQKELRSENEVDGPQFKMTNDPRLTCLGAWLRRTNIDELPQLINVLKGEMSLVGPRPSPDGENQFCPGWRRARLSVKPGITGLWQVMRLRNQSDSDFQEWIYYDLEYVKHCSLWLDWQLMLHTPMQMLGRSGRLARFALKLAKRGICVHSARVGTNGARDLTSEPLPPAGERLSTEPVREAVSVMSRSTQTAGRSS